MPTTINQATFPTIEGGDFLDECALDFSLTINERLGRTGEITKTFNHKTVNKMALKGGGDPAIAIGDVTMTVTGLTGGKKVCPNYKLTFFNDKPSEFSSDVNHYPSAA
jgi:hypothetical protein